MNWFFPVLMVLMFGWLIGGAIHVPAGGSYFEFLMPGMFGITMFFGFGNTMIAVTTDASKGITDRFRSLPINGVAVVLGRCVVDMLDACVGLAILIGTGLLLGWRWHGSLATALSAFGLVLLLRFALLWIGIFIGLIVSRPESLTAVQILIWPLTFLSNVFVDPSTMPSWLGVIAQWNPLSVTITAMRELFINPGWQAHSWVTEHAVLMALFWPILIAAIFLPLSVRAYRRLSH
jgi:ABC-2 type transport system permease protein